MTGIDLNAGLDIAGGDEQTLAFVAQSTDFDTAIDIAFSFEVGGELYRGHLATLPKSAIPKLVSAITPFIAKA